MSVEMLPAMSTQLANAYRITETLVLRTNQGAVYTIEIGEPLLAAGTMGAKVTLLSNPPTHIGVCDGGTIEDVRTAAQQLVVKAIREGVDTTSPSPIPKPHIQSSSAKISA